MAAISDRDLKIIQNLNKIEENFRLNTNQNILDRHGLTEKILEFQEPVIKEIKQISVTEGKHDQSPMQTVMYSNKKPRQNNSYFTPSQKTGDFLIFHMNSVDKLKLDSNSNDLEILKPDGTSAWSKLTDGLKALLFEGVPDTSIVTEDDLKNYFEIHQELKNDPGNSKRMKVIRNLFPEVSKRYPSIYFKTLANRRAIEYPGSGMSAKGNSKGNSKGKPKGNSKGKPKGKPKGRGYVGSSPSVIPVDLTGKTPVQLYHDLALLKAAKQAGNTNTLGKANMVLDKLKELSSISDKRYDKLINYFTS